MQALNEQMEKSQRGQIERRSSGEGREAVPPTPNGNIQCVCMSVYLLG